MKRSCLFFLAFVVSVFLAVFTGSFESRPGAVTQEVDNADASVASWEKEKLPARVDPKTTAPDISKKTIP